MFLWVVLEGIWIRSETVNIAGYQMRLLVWRVVKKTALLNEGKGNTKGKGKGKGKGGGGGEGKGKGDC